MEGHQTAADQITIYYNPDNNTHEKAVAHAKGTGKQVLAIPYADAPSAYNVWTQIYEQLPFPKNEFFDNNDERYASLIEGRDFSFDDWRKLAIHNPDLIDVAVAISGEKVIALNRQTEVYRLQELGPEAAEQRVPEDAKLAEANKAHNSVDGLGTMLDR